MLNNNIIQFEIWKETGNGLIKPIPYNSNNKGAGYYTYKPLKSSSSKAKFFDNAFNWLAEYHPFDEDYHIKIKSIHAQLQTCKYKLNPKPNNLLNFFKRLKRLKAHHFDNWTFKKFLKRVR